jgi:formylglycine-generating enzyme required for sulfatase activity
MLGVILKVCEAMAFAHAKGVFHRDIKPSNIMVGRFGETYVMDWGLAKVSGHEDSAPSVPPLASSAMHTVRDVDPASPDSPLITNDGRVIGTPSFMALEQAEGRVDKVDARTDVYAVGALMYQMLSGVPPYASTGAAMSPRTILARVLTGPPVPIAAQNPAAPPDLVAICEKAMSRVPEDRYASMRDLAADIEAFLDRRPMPSQPPRVFHALALAVQRYRAVAVTLAAAGAVLLVIGAWFLVSLSASRRASERLADLMAVRGLLEEERSVLTPRVPTAAEHAWRWQARVCALLDRKGLYRAELKRGAPVEPLSHDELTTLVSMLDDLESRQSSVAQDLTAAETLAREPDAATSARWSKVFEDLAADPRLATVALVRQPGLLPLGKNEAGFWQFLLLGTGDTPVRDEQRSTFTIGSASGVVMVLLPGGDIRLGGDEDPRNAPERVVSLSPFLLAAHETTQGQWQRLVGSNPSRRRAGSVLGAVHYDDRHPVELVSWFEATRFAAQNWARLPTEDELEYAGRAGAPNTRWFDGRLPEELEGRENVNDLSRTSVGSVATWTDNYPYHAPVGTFAANAFGLFDIGGNVSEWTSSYFGQDDSGKVGQPDPPGTPERLRLRVIRGASWGSPLNQVRASFRQRQRPEYSTHWVGVRLARDWLSQPR